MCLKNSLLFSLILLLTTCSFIEQEKLPDYPISAVPFTDVRLTDTFWSKRIQTNREVTIPFGFKKCEEEGRVRNFARAAGFSEGGYEGEMPFDDSDIYKILEGASYSLQTHPDPELDAYMDAIIDTIAAAQEDDGYLCTWRQLDPDTTPAWWVKPGPRWYNLASSHELYNLGHMYEAAYAHYQATGKSNFLNVALKSADLIDSVFGPGKNSEPPGHQIIETGLIKLYRITKKEKYLELARFFLNQRGNSNRDTLWGDYNQDHMPVVNQTEAVGHAVRAVYMYAAMTDIAGMLNDSLYLKAVNKIWDNVVANKIYITGGIGSRHEGEAFGDNYDLPNLTSYNETCAAIANVYWNHRMFLLHGDARYIDVLERTLYNGLVSGVSLHGDSFFYPNCLESDGKYAFNRGALTRKAWFDCSCCPSNIIRFMPSVSNYIYAHQANSLFVNLFVDCSAVIKMEHGNVDIEQNTGYPWEGAVRITVYPENHRVFKLHVRIPGWINSSPLPGGLYRFLETAVETVQLSVNGAAVDYAVEKGYAVINRKWFEGDVVELTLPMPVRRVLADERVNDDVGKVALVRGPITYAAEWPDNDIDIPDLVVPDHTKFDCEFNPGLLGGVSVVTGQVENRKGKKVRMTAIPYYAWSHRGIGGMAVWLNRK